MTVRLENNGRPTDSSNWWKRAYTSLSHVADRHWQRDHWLGKGRDPAGPTRLYDELLIAVAIEDFLASPKMLFNQKHIAAGAKLVAAMKACRPIIERMPPAELIGHPRWRDACVAARELLDQMKTPSYDDRPEIIRWRRSPANLGRNAR